MVQCVKVGLRGRVLKFIGNFLQNRNIRVRTNNTLSNTKCVMNGLPQGSVLSPTLFNILLHDMDHKLPHTSKIEIYADDITILSSDKDLVMASRNIQEGLNEIYAWTNKMKLIVSSSKSECSVFTRRHSLKDFRPNLHIGNIPLQYNEFPKILGVVMDPKLLWKNHIHNIIESANKRLSLLKIISSNKWGAETCTLRQFYISYIRPKLTYACEVWGGASNVHVHKLNTIQNAALRNCLGCLKTTPISAMEMELNIENLNDFIQRTTFTNYVKNQTLPKTHPSRSLVPRDNLPKQSFCKVIFDMKQKINIGEISEIPIINSEAPWNWEIPIVQTEIIDNLTKKENKEKLLQTTCDTIYSKYPDSVHIYTDGSLSNECNGGASCYVPENMLHIIIFHFKFRC